MFQRLAVTRFMEKAEELLSFPSRLQLAARLLRRVVENESGHHSPCPQLPQSHQIPKRVMRNCASFGTRLHRDE
jgi:hypothetical protein